MTTLMKDAFDDTDQEFSGSAGNLFLNVQDSQGLASGTSNDTISSWGVGDTLSSGSQYNFGSSTQQTTAIYSAGAQANIIGGGAHDVITALGNNDSVSTGQFGADVTLTGANSSVTSTQGSSKITLSGTNETVVSGGGNSSFYINDTTDVVSVLSGGTTDSVYSSVSYTAPTNTVLLTLTGTGNISATGNAGTDTLIAGAGNDTLIAGSGADVMIGGTGNTTFVVNSASDQVRNSNTNTSDTVISSVNYVLPTNVNTLVLTGSANLVGTANSGHDTLVSNSGVDTLIGGSGPETFVINNPNDVIENAAAGSTIIVNSSVTYVLPSTVDILVFNGTGPVLGTGNSGNDTLISNAGIDTLVGNGGNDLFIVNNSSDVVIENSPSVKDTIQSSVSFTAPTNVNVLQLTGTANISASGNNASDTLIGGAGNDTLVAGGVPDTLIGGTGNTTFVVNDSRDVVQNTTGANDTVQSSATTFTLATNVNTLILTGSGALTGIANSGNDTLVSNTGADTLVGGGGNDLFVVNNSADVIQESHSLAADTVQSSVSYGLTNPVQTLVLTGANLTGTAAAGSRDTLVAGAAGDTLQGSGTTVFVISDGSDVLQESSSFANDTLLSSASYTLPTNVNTLTLTGSSNLVATGNSGRDVITGNAGNDTLIGGSGPVTLVAGSGIDTLVGGTGPAEFVINNAADVIQNIPVSQARLNSVQSSVNFVLPTGIDNLTLTGAANLVGTGNSDADLIVGNDGSDTLIAGGSLSTLIGGTGDDLFVVNSSTDIVQAGVRVANDTIQSSASFTLINGVNTLVLTGSGNLLGVGNSAANLILGNAGNDTLQGGAGNDTLVAGSGIATLLGGAGNDTFIVNNVSDVVQDTVTGHQNAVLSSVSFTLPTNVNALVLTGSADLIGTANSGNDSLTANSGNDTLIAGSGNDTLVSGSGTNVLVAGSGQDTFVINNAGDVIQGVPAGSNDAILSSVSYVLPTGINVLTLTGAPNLVATGNSANDSIVAGAGNDTLIAGSGIDTLVGGAGNTTFVVNNTADVVRNASVASQDTIKSSVNYVLPTNVNTLVLTGAGLRGTGNAAADTLVAAASADTLVGGGGNTMFVIGSADDVVQESSSSAHDTIQTSVSYVLSTNVNTLILTGSGNLAATGNTGNDTLVSNSGMDTLSGAGGSNLFVVNNSGDVLQDSFGGNDTVQSSVSYALGAGINTLVLTGSAALTATGNAGNDLIEANGGGDTLVAGSAADTLVGGAGADLFVVNSSSDVVLNGGPGDSIESSVSYTLAGNANALLLTGSGSLTATANAGNDTLISNSGVDTLIGGSGADVFVINNAADVIENLNSADTIFSSVSYSLPSGTNNLVLIGPAAIAATGNGAADVLSVTGTGNDTLDPGSGNSTLIGGPGNDTFIVYNTGDVVEDPYAGTSSTVESSISYTLPTNIDNLVLTGTADLIGIGNTDATNVITANSGSDLLVGNAYSNTLVGGTGVDTLYAGFDLNVMYSGDGGTAFAPTQVRGDAPGTDELTQNTIYGGAGNNILFGGAGTNLIYGGSGTSTIWAGAGSNVIYMGSGGTKSAPVYVRGSSPVTTNATQSTIYGGSGADVIYGGQGEDVIYAGTGAATIIAGTGFEVIYGGDGSNISDSLSGDDVIIAGAGSETLTGTANDTLISGSGSDYLLSSGTLGGVPAYQINSGSNDTIGNLIDGEIIQFGDGITASDLSVTAAAPVSTGWSQTDIMLVINDGSGSVYVSGGMEPGGIGSIKFADGSSESLLSLVQSGAPQGTFVLPYANTGDDFVFSNGPGQFVNADSLTDAVYAFGDNDSVNTTAAQIIRTDYIYGNNTTVNGGGSIWAGGTSDLIDVTQNGSTTLAGANDTAIGAGTNAFTVYYSSDVVQEEPWVLAGSLTSYADYTLPANVRSMYLANTVNGLVGRSNSFGGNLVAYGNSDTLYGGVGVDTLDAEGNFDVLVGGTGAEDYILANPTDSIVFNPGADPLRTTVNSVYGYTLTADADNLVIAGDSQVGVGNSANDSLTAFGKYDTLVAGSGNDTLTGYQYSWPTTLIGGSGNDTFVVYENSNKVIDNSTTSNNTLIAWQTYTLPTNVNTLITEGTFMVGTANGANDLLIAEGSSETLVGGTGNDTFESSGTSGYTFLLNSGFGHDEAIIDPRSLTSIEFGTGITQSSLTFTGMPGTNGSAPSLVISGAGGSLTVVGGLVPGLLQGVSFNGSSTLVPVGQLVAPSGLVTVAGANGNLLLDSTVNDVVNGGSGDDTIIGYGSGESLNAGAGGALIYGGGANEKVTGGSGVDTLVADGSSDTLVAGTGTESLVVNSSTTKVSVGAVGNDTVYTAYGMRVPDNVTMMSAIGTRGGEYDANDLNDLIIGNGGSDVFFYGAGVDTFIGGSFGNEFWINNTADVVECGQTINTDTIISTVSYTLPANVDDLLLWTGGLVGTGNSDNDSLGGNNCTLISGSGIDTLSAGDNSLIVINNASDYVARLGANDTINTGTSFTLASNPNDSLSTLYWNVTGSADVVENDEFADSSVLMTANSGNDMLIGAYNGNIIFYGGSGIDTMIGGGGGGLDIAYVNNAADVVIFSPGPSNGVYSSVDIVMPLYTSQLTLQGTGLVATGNSGLDDETMLAFGGDTLIGGSGNENLMSQTGNGNNTMVAGTGDDTIRMYAGDAVVFDPGFGNSSVSVASGGTGTPLIEFGSGVSPRSLTVSALPLSQPGLAIAGSGGVATLAGGLGNTPYGFQFAGGSVLTLAQFLAQVQVANSTVAGASGNVVLNGTAGVSIAGGTGNDTIYATGAADTIVGGSGRQVLVATGANASAVGGSGAANIQGLGMNDTLVGGSVADTLTGGTGANVLFVVNNTSDSVRVQSNPGSDTIQSSVTFTLPTNVNTIVLTAASTKATGNSGNDTLISSSVGVDTLAAGAGNDLLIVNFAGDSVSAPTTHGVDTIQSAFSFSLANSTNVADLVLTGTGNLSGTGNGLANVIVANSGNDTLTAGTGLATLIGGGNDLFVVNNSSDVIQDTTPGAHDTINSSANFTLPGAVNILTLTGSGSLVGAGNNNNDLITGNTGRDTLIAGPGTDTLVSGSGITSLVGGAGTDIFQINNASDTVTVGVAGGNDSILSSVSFTLPTNVQYLALSGSASLTGSGNSLTDLIIGNTGNDTLNGGTGIAVLEGGTAGHDVIKGISNQAALIGGGAADTLTGSASKDFYAAGKVSDVITTGATANVIAINMGDGADTLNATTGATNVLSLGGGIDTENLTFTKSGNNLVLSDGVAGDTITFANWYSATSNQDYVTLQVVEAASASYNPTSSDALRNKPLEEFNFTSLASQFNGTGTWSLSTGMPSATLPSSATAAYGGDLAYYFGLNGNLTGLNLTDAQSTLTNAAFATGTQTINPFANVTGGPIRLV
jgi:Ca2+-binding RTX toxin-like protein